jgi:voltage-gated potassium channel
MPPMTNREDPAPEPRATASPPWRVIARSVLRAAGSVIVFVTAYYLLPLDTSVTWAAIAILVTGLVVLLALIAFQVRSILRSPFPGLRAIEALAVAVPLFLLLFASTYVVMDRVSRGSFTQPLTHTDGLYFVVTVFTTVGFGDITPRSEAARLVVTVQMITDVVIIGLAIQAIVGAARHGRQRQSAKS